ncbi:MAG: CHAT domain-containing tetratricopeptide repeat protein [Bacteroidota bacterium]
MKSLTILCFFIFFISSGYCQESKEYTKLSYKELDSLIDNLIEQEKYTDAIPLVKAFIQNAEKERDDSLRAYGLNEFGILNEGIGNYNDALKLYLEVKDIREKVFGKKHPEYAQSLNNLALLNERMGNYEQALPLYLQAKEIEEKVLGKENPEYASTLSNLAYLYEVMGNYEKALLLYLQAKDIEEKVLGKQHPDYAISINNLAVLLWSMGNYEQALTLYLQAKDINERALGKEHSVYAISLNNLALLYESMGNYEQALTHFLNAKNIQEKALGKEHPEYATTLNNLANLYEAMGSYKKALPLFSKVLEIDEKVLGKEHPYYATSLNNLAELYESMKNYSRALSLYLQTKDIYEKSLGKKHPYYIQVFNSLAALYKDIGNYDQAWEVLKQVMKSSANLQRSIILDKIWYDELLETKYLSNAHLETIIKSLSIAYQLLEKDSTKNDVLEKQILVADLANALLVKARNRVSNEQDKLRILSQSNDWLQRSLQILDPEIHAIKAFNLSDQNKSVLLLESTKSESAYELGDLPDSLILKDRNLLKKQSELQAGLLGKGTDMEKDSLRNELNDINQDIIEFVRTIEREYPKYHKIKYQQVDVKVEDIQASLDKNTALLEYVVGDSIIHIFYIDKEQMKWSKTFIDKSALKDHIQSLHVFLSDQPLDQSNKILQQSYQDYTEHAHWFYQNLLAPVLEDKSEINNLIIITDGELGHLPFETFLVKKASSERVDYHNLHYLLNDYNISYNYSATLWKENIEAPLPRNNGQILGMAANYDFTLDSSMISVRLPTDQWKRGDISPLPAARKEVEILQEKYEGFFALDSLASEKTAKMMAPEFSVLHFATHGILDKDKPVLSSLVFTEDNDSSESNFWEAHEISKTQLYADLVVLSACQTGYGKFEKGNGIASLARAFMYAGAPSLIVSLWQVNDRTTSELMRHFYDNLDEGLKKDEALRKAKLKYIKYADGISAHPSYWAPFITIGKTSAVHLDQKSNLKIWLIGIILLCSIGLGGFLLKRKAL